MARGWIFLIATVLSFFGMLANALEIFALLTQKKDWPWGVSQLVASVFAWSAYFAMGDAWTSRGRMRRGRLIAGTIAALVALSGGGAFLFEPTDSMGTSKWLVIALALMMHAAYVLPAVLLAIWMLVSLTRAERRRVTCTAQPSDPGTV